MQVSVVEQEFPCLKQINEKRKGEVDVQNKKMLEYEYAYNKKLEEARREAENKRRKEEDDKRRAELAEQERPAKEKVLFI